MRCLPAIPVIVAALTFVPRAVASEPVAVDAMLILASDKPAAMDPRLDRVEYRLRRIFGFEYYSLYGSSSGALNVPGVTTMDLGHGYTLSVDAKKKEDGKVVAEVRWHKGDVNLVSTRVSIGAGAPVVLGGPQDDEGTLILTLMLR